MFQHRALVNEYLNTHQCALFTGKINQKRETKLRAPYGVAAFINIHLVFVSADKVMNCDS